MKRYGWKMQETENDGEACDRQRWPLMGCKHLKKKKNIIIIIMDRTDGRLGTCMFKYRRLKYSEFTSIGR